MFPIYENKKVNILCSPGHPFQFPYHLHEAIELVLCTDRHSYLGIDGKDYVLHSGDFIMAFPNTLHCYYPGPTDNIIPTHIMLISSLKYCGSFTTTLTQYRPINPYIPAGLLHPNVSFAIKQILEEVSDPSSTKVYQALIQLILSRVMPLYELEKVDTSENYDLTGRIVRYIGGHFQEPLTLTSVADSLHVSKYHLSHVFSDKMHTNFNSYLSEYRLNYSVSLIHTSDHTLTEIWNEAGFESQRTFNRVFHQTYEMSPSTYRSKEKE